MYGGFDGIEPNPGRAEHFRKRLVEYGGESLLQSLE
jgi:hypothetical protein